MIDQLQLAVQAQEEHPVYPRLTYEQLRDLSPDYVLTLLNGRATRIRQEKEDPYRYGYEPAFWDEVDWAVARRRAQLPGVVLEVLILGGNRAGKTDFAAKRMVQSIVENAGWDCCMLHADESASRAVQQTRVWKYLPPEWKPDSGKVKKSLTTKLNYNQLSGFTENAFSLGNSSRARFKFYSAEVTSLEGMQFDSAWSDELIPLNWVEAIEFRLLTLAEKTRALSVELGPWLRAKEADPTLKFPRALLPRLYQGVHLITFTPIEGYTPTCARFLNGATTLSSVPAELLPITDRQGNPTFEQVPRLQLGAEPHRLIAYFHTYDNKYGGNWEGMKAKLRSQPANKIKERAYGVPTSAYNTRFPKFSIATHVRPEGVIAQIVKDATFRHVVDPCPGRNYAMAWLAVTAAGQHFILREWPQEDDYIPGVGSPGPWAVPSTGSRKDGDRGPAQKGFGFGIKSYKREIKRIEQELHQLIYGSAKGSQQRLPIEMRIMDSRGGAAPTLAAESPTTLIDLMFETDPADPEDESLEFIPSSKTLTNDGGSATINDGVELVNDLLFYDESQTTLTDEGVARFHGAAPRLYVCQRCTNTIFALTNWTGEDGQKGACKDFADLPRYYAQSNPDYLPPTQPGYAGRRTGGCY